MPHQCAYICLSCARAVALWRWPRLVSKLACVARVACSTMANVIRQLAYARENSHFKVEQVRWRVQAL